MLVRRALCWDRDAIHEGGDGSLYMAIPQRNKEDVEGRVA